MTSTQETFSAGTVAGTTQRDFSAVKGKTNLLEARGIQ
jgi:hypothetical protein